MEDSPIESGALPASANDGSTAEILRLVRQINGTMDEAIAEINEINSRTKLLALAFAVITVDSRLFPQKQAPPVVQTPPHPPHLTLTPAAPAAAPAVPMANDEALTVLAEADSRVQDALAKIEVWQTEIEPLRTNAEGQAIAADTELTTLLKWLFDQERPPLEELQAARQRIGELRGEVQQSSTGALAANHVAEIRELHSNATLARDQWHNDVESAHAIRRQAIRNRMRDAPGEPSLVERMKEVEDT